MSEPTTVMEKFRWIMYHQDHGHLPDCTMQDLSYCLDCSCGVNNLLHEVRAEGFTQYPAELLAAPTKDSPVETERAP